MSIKAGWTRAIGVSNFYPDRKERMIGNLDVFNFTLSPEDMKAIEDLDEGESAVFSHCDPQTVEYLTNRGK